VAVVRTRPSTARPDPVAPWRLGAPAVTVRRWGRPLAADRFAVLDVETTGLAPDTDRVIEVAVVTTDRQGQVTDEWSVLVDPGRDPGPTDVHGITTRDLAGAAGFAGHVHELAERLHGAVLVAHNLAFDAAFLRAEGRRIPDQAGSVLDGVTATLCTLDVSRQVLARPADGWSLASLCASTDVPLVDAHRALADARATAGLLAVLLGQLPLDRRGLLHRRLTARR